MAKPSITTRAAKGSALTWTEGDNNLTNLRDATITIQAGTGGTNVVSDLNGTVTLVAGTNITLSGDNTAKTVTITGSGGGASTLNDLTDVTISGSPMTGQVLKWSTATSQWTNQSDSGIDGLYADPNPSLGGNLTVMGYSIVSAAGGDIAITPSTTGSIVLDGQKWPQADGTSNQVLKTDGAGQLSWTTLSAGITDLVQDTSPQLGGDLDVNSRKIVSTSNGTITIQPDGTGDIELYADTVRLGDANTLVTVTTNGTGDLVLRTNNGSTSGDITIGNGANGNITLAPNGTGKTKVNAINYNEGAIYDLGTTGGTVAPNVANGNVQKITLNAALTINAFTSPVAGQSLTLIIYGGTAYTSITSTMKFAGGIKTLTGTAGCIDILSVYYDGSTYFASLGKGFA